jgi:hypothetical protein
MKPSLKRLLLMPITWTPLAEGRVAYAAVVDGVEHRLVINQLANDAPFCTLSREGESLDLQDAPSTWSIPQHPRNEGAT